jgi:DNA polymerase III delta subunit
VRTAKENGGIISSNDARYLVERVGANQQMLSGELDKLLLYESQYEGRVSRESIDLLTDRTPQSTIFQLLETAFAGNIRQTFALYEEQRALKVEPQQIVAMLAWQLHILALIKTAGQRNPADIAKEAKLSPYVVQKSAAIVRSLSLVKLKELIGDLLDIDAKSKRSNLDIDEALQRYLLKLSPA